MRMDRQDLIKTTAEVPSVTPAVKLIPQSSEGFEAL